VKILVCSAHPDDETLGAGGTLIRWANDGHQVTWVVFTRPWEPQWTRSYIVAAHAQAVEAASRLGVARTVFLDHPAALLDTVEQRKLNDDLGRVVREVQPDTLLTVWAGDVHRDHRAVAEAVMVATRPYPGQSVRRVLAYETASSTEWSGVPFPANVYVEVTATLDAKLHALAAYASEAKEAPHPRSAEGVRARASLRGFEVGLPAAEAFHLIRDIS
jgi:LmbE family N-acetylglucosaminyl deacetylase